MPLKNKVIDNNELIKASLFGFFIGDALGVPVEFLSRESLKNNKVKDMLEYGTHNQPKGTWSDDSSMVLATIDGLIYNKTLSINYKKIMDNFLLWRNEGKYTPFDRIFDIGNATNNALSIYSQNIKNNIDNVMCGSSDINSNGNGSLMRILPIALYLYHFNFDYSNYKMFEIIKTISSMTHSHNYSILGCYIYTCYVNELLKTHDKITAYKNIQYNIQKMVDSNFEIQSINTIYGRIIFEDISKLKESEIKSSGYVVDSLEAAIWCVLTSNSFEETVLKAVNLGEDTDTIGALAASLAGIIYGINDIPKKWINSLQKKDYLIDIVDKFILTLTSINEEISFDINMLDETIYDLKNNPKACTNEMISSHPSEQLHKFIKYFYNSDKMDKNYLENYKNIESKEISVLTHQEVITFITSILRGDRFCDGYIYSCVKEGMFLKLLERLRETLNERK